MHKLQQAASTAFWSHLFILNCNFMLLNKDRRRTGMPWRPCVYKYATSCCCACEACIILSTSIPCDKCHPEEIRMVMPTIVVVQPPSYAGCSFHFSSLDPCMNTYQLLLLEIIKILKNCETFITVWKHIGRSLFSNCIVYVSFSWFMIIIVLRINILFNLVLSFLNE